MRLKRFFNLPIVAGFLSVGLYSQINFEYNARLYHRLAYKIPAAIVISTVSAMVYTLMISWIVRAYTGDHERAEAVFRKFSRLHLIFLGYTLFILQFVFTKTNFFNMYLPACVIVPFGVAVLVFFVREILVPALALWKKRETALLFFHPSLFILFLVGYYLSWHYSAAYIFLSSTNISNRIVNTDMLMLFALYASLFTAIVTLYLLFLKRYRAAANVTVVCGAALFCFSFVLRYFDLGIYYFGGDHISSDVWTHMFYGDSLSFLFTGFALFILMMFVAGICGLLFFALRAKRFLASSDEIAAADPGMRFTIQLNAVFALLLIACVGLTVHFPENRYQQRYDSWVYSSVPEKLVVSSFFSYYYPGAYERKIDISPELSAKFAAGGIKLGPADEKYPLMKESIYFDRKTIIRRKPVAPPNCNIIIVFAESFSQFFVEKQMHGRTGLTPNFDDLKGHSVYFSGMYNAVYPTITGIMASLCSFPYYIDDSRAVRNNRLSRTKFRFISRILKDRGYQTAHMQGGSSSFASTETLMKNQGFDTFVSIESEDLRKSAKNEAGKWGLRDIDLMKYCVEFLEKRNRAVPLMLTVSTIDMHNPYICCDKQDCGFGSPLLDCVHSTDLAFGYLWDYIKNSDYYNDTIVVFIADHSITPNPVYMSLRRDGFDGSRVDYIAAAMYVPGNRSYMGTVDSTVCTNLDLTPTLLDVMNIDTPNPFLGLSIFSERPKYPSITGRRILADRLTGRQLELFRSVNLDSTDEKKMMDLLKSLTVQNRITR